MQKTAAVLNVSRPGTSDTHVASHIALGDQPSRPKLRGGPLGRDDGLIDLRGVQSASVLKKAWYSDDLEKDSREDWLVGELGRLLSDMVAQEMEYIDRRNTFLEGLVDARRIAVEAAHSLYQAQKVAWEEAEIQRRSLLWGRVLEVERSLETWRNTESSVASLEGRSVDSQGRSVAPRRSTRSLPFSAVPEHDELEEEETVGKGKGKAKAEAKDMEVDDEAFQPDQDEEDETESGV